MNLVCPHCGGANFVAPTLFGQNVNCGFCRGIFHATPPAASNPQSVYEEESPRRRRRSSANRSVYILLGFFLGCFGVHNFYAGRTGTGVAQLLITLFTGWVIVGLLITGLWSIVEIIAVKHDGSGLEMS